MRLSVIAIFVSTLLAFPAAADEYLPEPCAAQPQPPPASFRCPSPYEEMAPGGRDPTFLRAWHCRETGYSLGQIREGGCGGSRGLAMFPNWLLPNRPSAPPSTPAGSYKETALDLFHEFLAMKHDGVFMRPRLVRMWTDAGLEFPDETRGDHPPGGFFGRPPGSEWVTKVEQLRDAGESMDLADQCFDIPKDLSEDDSICGFDLISLISVSLPSSSGTELNDLTRRFWLAKICHEQPDACELGR